jgi:uncharacterized membrane protein YeaQ/YmgE (transglycosylase-associated protein family)
VEPTGDGAGSAVSWAGELVRRTEWTMWFLSWIVIGLIMGAIARAIMPGRAAGGWVVTLIVGVVGAFVGGFIGRAFGSDPNQEFWSFSTWFWAFIGSLVVLLIWGLIAGRRSKA